jgi:hypothetical protein
MPDNVPHDIYSRLVAKHGHSIYVILMKDDRGNLTLLADPGMNLPWHSKNERLAKFHADQCSGMAATWHDAWKLLLKENPNFEKELVERAAKVHTDLTKQKLDQNSLAHGINTNATPSSDGTILDSSGKPSVDPSNN